MSDQIQCKSRLNLKTEINRKGRNHVNHECSDSV